MYGTDLHPRPTVFSAYRVGRLLACRAAPPPVQWTSRKACTNLRRSGSVGTRRQVAVLPSGECFREAFPFQMRVTTRQHDTDCGFVPRRPARSWIGGTERKEPATAGGRPWSQKAYPPPVPNMELGGWHLAG